MARGRPPSAVPEASADAIRAVKEIVKQYQKLKQLCVYVPKKRRGMFRSLEVSTAEYSSTGGIEYNREISARIPEEDRRVMERYEENMKKVWLLEHGVASITNERTRAIAKDTLLRGIPVERLMKKYELSRRHLFREKKNAVSFVAAFYSAHIQCIQE